MRYIQPYGITDPNAPYINGNPAAGIQGSIPPAAAFEHPMRELVHAIESSGYTPSESDLYQLIKAIRSQRVNYVAATATANAIVATMTPTLDAYTLGLAIKVKILANNTGPATININSLGAIPIKRANGAALEPNDLIATSVVELVFDGTNFQITNFIGAATSTTNNYYSTDIPYVADSSAVANSIIAAFAPAITSLTAGSMIEVKLANSVTGPTTIKVNALANVAVKKPDGTALGPGDATAGQMLLLQHDGTAFQLVGARSSAGMTIRRITKAQYEGSAPSGGLGLTGVGIAAGTGGQTEILKITGIPKATGYKRRISFNHSTIVVSGSIIGEQTEHRIQRSTDGGLTWETMIAPWCGVSSYTGPPTEYGYDSDGGTLYDDLDTADAYRMSAQSYGDGYCYTNHARLVVEEIG